MKKFVTCLSALLITLYTLGAVRKPVQTTGEWNDPANWSPRGIPANGDDVIIPAGYTVTLKKSTYDKTTTNLNITIEGTLSFDPSGKLYLGILSTIKLTKVTSRIQSNGTGSELISIGTELKYDGKKDPRTITGPAFSSIDTGVSPFGGFNPIPVPIHLTQFSAKPQEGGVVLYWRTGVEENAEYFQMERSANAIHWQPLGTVPTKGSNSGYSYNDIAPLAVTGFYRLKMVDLDGSYEYSPVVKVAGEGMAALQLGPNPTTSYLNVSLAQPGSTLLQLQVVSSSGQVLRQQAAARTGFSRLSLVGLAPGQYYLLVCDDKQLLISKAFVVK